jgi:hypothetical protein
VLLRFDHRLIVCNDRFVEVYNIPADRVRPGMKLTEIVDLRIEAGSFPAMTRKNISAGATASRAPTSKRQHCRIAGRAHHQDPAPADAWWRLGCHA